MAKIIKFPGERALVAAPDNPSADSGRPRDQLPPGRPRPSEGRIGKRLHAVAWVLVAMTSPLWMRIAVFDLLYQICRTVYHWQTPGMHPGWTMSFHALGAALLCIFFMREPKGLQ